MTYEEAIKRFEPIVAHEAYTDSFQDACKLAIEALQKQIPKRPNLEADGYDNNGELIYDTWVCPTCEKYYEVDYDDYKYCPECGQVIDWDGEGEKV